MKYVIANWKMNPQTAAEAGRLFSLTAKFIKKIRGVKVILCPPFVWLGNLKSQISNLKSRIALGAQDIFWESQGAFTGEISPKMLKDLGCSYVIVGHSERRWKIGESDQMVNLKLQAALKARLRPILCVGERDRKGDWHQELILQLKSAFERVPSTQAREVIIAYEPVWAIGTGVPDTPEDVLSSAILIRKTLLRIFRKSVVQKISLLYGGSVNSSDVHGFVAQEGIDGVLVGGASLNALEFSKIVRIVSQTKNY